MEKLLGHPKTGSIDPPKNLATPEISRKENTLGTIKMITYLLEESVDK